MKRGIACASRSDASGAAAAVPSHPSSTSPGGQPGASPGYSALNALHSSLTATGSTPSVVHISTTNLNRIRPVQPLHLTQNLLLNRPPSTTRYNQVATNPVYNSLNLSLNKAQGVTQSVASVAQTVSLGIAGAGHTQTVSLGQIHAPAVTSVSAVNVTQAVTGATGHQIVYSSRVAQRIQTNAQIPSVQTTYNSGVNTVTTPKQQQQQQSAAGTTAVTSEAPIGMQSALSHYQPSVQVVSAYAAGSGTTGPGRPQAVSTAAVKPVIQVRQKVHVTTTNSPPSTPVVFQIQATTTSSPPSVINTPSLSVAVAAPQAAVGHHVGPAPSPMVVHASKSPTVTHHSQSMPGHVVHTPHHTSLVVASMGTHHGQNATTQITNTQQNSLGQSQQQSNTSFQRLKVEDALSYLDKVKYKFGDQPQVYNDFLDIMKEFKSQSIDTPGVIERVSNLFKEHPELIEGFNTFLPPGYKIEVKPVDQGYSYQVSVSMPSPTQSTTTLVHTQGPGQRLSSPPMTGGQSANAVSQPQSAKSTSVMQIMQGSNIIHTTMAAAANIVSGASSQSQASSGQATAPQPASGSAAPAPHQATAAAPQASPVHAAPASGAALHHHYQPIGSGNIQHSNNNVHHSISQAQAHQAVSQALSQVETGHSTPQNQPVEFNHAINYVNKIKNRFQGQPEKYKRFLEILHTYQKEQRNSKEPLPLGGANAGGGTHTHSNLAKHLTEAEVYSQVAKLFENQEDLLAEFGRFLPDANHHCALVNKSLHNDTHPKKPAMKPASYNSSAREHEREGREREHRDREHRDTYDRERDYRDREKERGPSLSATQKYGHSSGQVKRNLPYLSQPTRSSIIDSGPPLKKHKVASCRDVTFAEASKYGTLSDYAYFDKVRKALRSQEVYDNFLRCLVLYNEEIISRSELVQLVVPFLGKFPELFRWFKDFVGHSESGVEPISNNVARQERPQGELAMEVDLNTCKRLGASYCALPKAQADATYGTSGTGTTGISGLPPGAHIGSLASRRCSGRTPLCREVLNDTWVSFPTWSEDSTFVTNRKTQFEEYIYRCEDERFELDVVIETNASTIRVLEGVCRRLQRLSPDELQRFRLDDTLGGTSAVLHQRALRRIYGDKAPDIVDGLKRNPAVAVPVVLRRLKAKEDEWREAQKGFNKIWREQNEKYYLKSLDHQGINFKQNDIKLLRSKSLFNEIETIYDERHEQSEEGAQSAVPGSTAASGPHLILSYSANLTPNSSTPANPVISSATTTGTTNNVQPTGPVLRSVLDDAAGLLIHHVRRQTGAQKQEKARIKALLRQFIPDLFHHPRQQLSDDERDDDDDKEDDDDEDKVKTSPKNASRKSPDTVGAAEVKTEKKCSAGTSGTDVPMDVDGMEDVDLSAVKTEEDEHDPLYSIKNDPDEYYTLFIANSNWYLFLRLHAILCSRLATIQAHAQRLAEIEAAEQEKRKQSTAIALRLKPQPEAKVEKYYPAFLEMVKNLLDGNLDANTYEDTLREMFGIHAYIAFTLDKVVSYAVRQLQHCATERSAIECCSLFLNERRKAHPAHSGGTNRRDASFREKDFFKSLGKDIYSFTRGKSNNSDSGTFNSSGAGGPCATAYWRRAAEGAYQRTVETKIKNENCFKLYIYKNSLRVTMELIVYESDDADPQTTVSEAKKWSEYVEGFSNDGTGISLSSGEKSAKESSRSSGGRTGSSDQDSADVKNNEAGGDATEKGRKRTTDGDKAPKEEKGLSDQEGSENGVESILGTWSNRRAMFLKRNLRKFRQRAQRVASASSSTQNTSPASSGGPSGGGSSSSTSEDAARPPTERRTSADKDDDDNEEISELERKLAEKGIPERMNSGDPSATSDYVVDDKAQCRFNLNSYKMVYIVNKDTYLYKKGALTKAKESHLTVTKNLGSRFKAWHKKWINQHVLETQQKTTYDWLMGRSEGLCSNRTRVLSNNDTRRTPYVPYNRYRVERLPSAAADMEIG